MTFYPFTSKARCYIKLKISFLSAQSTQTADAKILKSNFHFDVSSFDLFDLIQIFREIASLNFQVSWGHQFLTEVKQILDFGIF